MLQHITFDDKEIKEFLSKLEYRFVTVTVFYPPYAVSDKTGRTEEKILALKIDEELPKEYSNVIHRDIYLEDEELDNHLMIKIFQKEIKNKLLGI